MTNNFQLFQLDLCIWRICVCVLSSIFSHSVAIKMDTFSSFRSFFSLARSSLPFDGTHTICVHQQHIDSQCCLSMCVCVRALYIRLYALDFMRSTRFCPSPLAAVARINIQCMRLVWWNIAYAITLYACTTKTVYMPRLVDSDRVGSQRKSSANRIWQRLPYIRNAYASVLRLQLAPIVLLNFGISISSFSLHE